MTHAERHIIETYSALFDSLSAAGKLALLKRLTNSIKKGAKPSEKDFFSSFGAFASDKSAEEIVKEIKDARKFSGKDIKL